MSKNILILSGPTHEYLDPVRFLGNASSGLMGKAIAEAATQRGYNVQFLTGPVAENNLPHIGRDDRMYRVTSADEMLEQASVIFQSADAIIFAAAVADYAPVEKHAEKMAKSEEDLILRLRATPDIAKTLCANKRVDQIAIGFALQSHEGEAHARIKLDLKNLDGIVLNTPATLGASTGEFSYLDANSASFKPWGCIDKSECARRVIEQLKMAIRER